MGYYQGSNNVYAKFDRPHYEMMPYPINYNQGGHDGTAGFGSDGDCTITAESPGNKGFEAPYWSANQWNSYSNTQNSRVNATGNAYMYFGNQYNKGPISQRGGFDFLQQLLCLLWASNWEGGGVLLDYRRLGAGFDARQSQAY